MAITSRERCAEGVGRALETCSGAIGTKADPVPLVTCTGHCSCCEGMRPRVANCPTPTPRKSGAAPKAFMCIGQP
eukprot:6175120-Pleurochrysis_carterae.AAC.2